MVWLLEKALWLTDKVLICDETPSSEWKKLKDDIKRYWKISKSETFIAVTMTVCVFIVPIIPIVFILFKIGG